MSLPYTKVKPLGSGAFGKVFLVRDRSGESAVLKEVPLRGLCQKEQKRSVAEAAVLRKLTHPHLVAYHDSCLQRSTATLCIVMEHCEGGDLAARIAACRAATGTSKRFSEKSVLRVAAQSVSALAYCHHKLFLLHRDIKPANIFLSRGGDVKIGDFGLSKSLAASHGLAQTKCGSPVYMSPELAAGRAYTGGCDVWALGCCLYEMMSLTTPWVEQHQPRTGIVGLMRLICTGTLDLKPLRAHYSAGLVELVGAMLAKRAADRPSFRSLLTHPVLKPMLEQMDARANQQPQPQPQPSQPQPSQPQPQPGAVGAPANPFEMRGPLARATPHATPQTTPRTSSPTGAVPIPAPPAFRLPQRAHFAPPPTECARGSAQDAAPSCRAHGADAHVAALAIQRSFKLLRNQKVPSPRSVLAAPGDGVAKLAQWEDQYKQLIAKRKQVLRERAHAAAEGAVVVPSDAAAFHQRMHEQQQRWARAQGR